MSRIHVSLWVAGALVALPGCALAIGLARAPAHSSVPALSFDLGDQVELRGVEPQFGATGVADLSAPAEDDEDGFYDRFQDQIGTLLAAGQTVEPTPDRFKWAILLIAFAGMTAAASGRPRARRATITI